MRLRCPNQGCPIDVPDGMIGKRILCPHCEQPLLADPIYQEGGSEQSIPNLSLDPTQTGPEESAKLEHGLHEGLPPLSVMMAVRIGRGASWIDETGLRKEMTELDWKALAAFEQVLLASTRLSTSLGLGAAASVFTALISMMAHVAQADPSGGASSSSWFYSWLASLLILGVALSFMLLGVYQLPRLRIGAITSLAAWSAFVVALVLAANALLSVFPFFSHGHAKGLWLVLLALSFPFSAAFAAARASLSVQRSIDEVSRPEVLSRLKEAMRFLE